jgi:ribosomal protein L30/L7E
VRNGEESAAKRREEDTQVTQILSPIGFDKKQESTLRGLGLRRIRHTWKCRTRSASAA